MASVYLAVDPSFRREVAIKVLPPQYLENAVLRTRFEREARAIATIEHPAIVPVYDFGEQDGQLFLVMRYMQGGSLATRMRRGRLSLDFTVQLISQLAPALDAVHTRGIIHRDLKPANILFDRFDNPALSDFGIAQLSEATLELTGEAMIGTPAYMSPEQVRGDPQMDGRCDGYALGVILFEMLTGQVPYRAPTPMSTAMRHLTEPVPQIRSLRPDLPVEIEPIVARALAKDPEERYAEATELAADLKSLPPAPVIEPDLTQVDDPAGALPDEASGKIYPGRSHPVVLDPAGERSSAPDPGLRTSGGRAQKPKPGTEHVRALLPWGIGGLALIAGLCLILILGGATLASKLLFTEDLSAAPTTQAAGIKLPIPATAALQDGPADVPSPEPGPTARPGSIIFSDDFSVPANGWPTGGDEGGEYGYQDGAYRILVKATGSLYWASPDPEYTDIQFEVETTKAHVSGGSYYGVLCRIQDPQNYYYLVVRDDGRYVIGKYQDGQFFSLLPTGWTFSEKIPQGQSTSSLQALCSGDRISLSINGEKLGEVRDDTFQSGQVGLIAASISDPETEVLFDNFTVQEVE
jgi:serine/threonine protein kinase